MKTNEQSQIEWGKNTIAIYHVVYAHEGFEESAQNLFTLVQDIGRDGGPKTGSRSNHGRRNTRIADKPRCPHHTDRFVGHEPRCALRLKPLELKHAC